MQKDIDPGEAKQVNGPGSVRRHARKEYPPFRPFQSFPIHAANSGGIEKRETSCSAAALRRSQMKYEAQTANPKKEPQKFLAVLSPVAGLM
jgi:hypothetical protein